jgi:4-hydroxybenzoate polyprenyltransferase
MLAGMLTTGYQLDLTTPFYLGTGAIWTHVLWQIWSADLDNPSNLWNRFSSNIYVGAAVTAAIMAGHF